MTTLCAGQRTAPFSHAGARDAPRQCGMTVMRMLFTTDLSLNWSGREYDKVSGVS